MAALPSDVSPSTPVTLPHAKLSLEEGEKFGAVLAADGGVLVVGMSIVADNDPPDWAVVYEKEADAWVQKAILEGEDDPIPRDEVGDQSDKKQAFGYAVAVDGDAGRVVVGDPGYDVEDETQAGAVYVFDRLANGTWAQSAMVCCPIVDGDDNELPGIHRDQPGFGKAVAIDGDRMVVGAPDAHRSTGKVWIFEETEGGTWEETVSLTEERPQPYWGSRFGNAVDLEADTLVVGAENSLDDEGTYGAVYLYEREGRDWERTERLTSPTRYRGGYGAFGLSVDLENGTMLTADPLPQGSPVQQFNPLDHGEGDKGYVFEEEGGEWTLAAVLDPNGPKQEWDPFLGRDVALGEDGQTAVLGADAGDPRALRTGSAYVFEEVEGLGWIQSSRLVSSEMAPYDQFGKATAIHGSEIFVSAPYDANPRGNESTLQAETSWSPVSSSEGTRAGSVFVFAPDALLHPTGGVEAAWDG